ncbi:MAG: XTP/dITP diphosphatase [Clostridia bacterium]|nr:XTP/dITP diphosphatase [Clostridia bacterium]
MMKVVFASNNAHKVSEFKSCLADAGLDIEILTIKETGFTGDIIESADTFKGNAYIKAKTLSDYTGLIAIADDSGLSVDALNGAPGVYSARFAGEDATDSDNIQKLLAELKDKPERSAKFVCTICVCRPDGETLYVSGESRGEIIDERRGDGTFGYDPVFYYPPFDKTFAEMTSDEKNSISHRGRAVEELLKHTDFFLK